MATDVLAHITEGTDLIVTLGPGEPVTVLDVIEEAGREGNLRNVRVHQMLPFRERPHHHGKIPGLRHVSYFLAAFLREPFEAGHVDLVPNDYSMVPGTMRRTTTDPLVLIATSLPDVDGWLSMGTNGDYCASLLGEARVFAEATPNMPHTLGDHRIHIDEVVGWCRTDMALPESLTLEPNDADLRISALVAERIPNGATLQIGIGNVPNAVCAHLSDHRHLGVHTELMAEGLFGLVASGVADGSRKTVDPGLAVATSILGDTALYRALDHHPMVRVRPVDSTNAFANIVAQHNMVAVNSTMEVDLLGQCASESLGTHYISSSGGQADFVRATFEVPGGQGFIVTRATAHDAATGEVVSRIVPTLRPGAVVTAHKNRVDKIVTEFGVAELRDRTVAERVRALIAIAAPEHRDDLTVAARSLGYVH
jgi:acyl-CoA hydrolase